MHDWSGPYVGLAYGRTSGSLEYENPAFSYDVEDGSARSIFLGYLVQRGNLVYGGEFAYSDIKDSTIVGFPAEEHTKAIDLKGRIGYATGKVLAYGVLGWSQVEFDHAGDVVDLDGISYGAGVKYAVTDRISLGLEYLALNTDGTSPNGAPQTTTADLDTLSLRIGYSF